MARWSGYQGLLHCCTLWAAGHHVCSKGFACIDLYPAGLDLSPDNPGLAMATTGCRLTLRQHQLVLVHK